MIDVMVSSLRFRGELELNKLPKDIQNMTMEEYCNTYKGRHSVYAEKKTEHLLEQEKEADEELQRTVKKRLVGDDL
jgi:hypothetical protein